MCVSAGNHQRQHRERQLKIPFLLFLQQNSVNMAFQMVHRYQRLIQRKRKRFGEADADQQCSREARALGHGNRVNGFVSLSSFHERLANHGNNGPQMLARRQLRHNSTVRLVRGNLG